MVEPDQRTQSQRYNSSCDNLTEIQNSKLFQQYQTRKESMERENETLSNEMRLWHGTSEDAMNNILANNFNRSYSGKNGLFYFYPL